MRHAVVTTPPDLAVLSAEQYDDPAFTLKAGKARGSPSAHSDNSPRKRARTSPTDATMDVTEDGQDKTKRARGRPRLDTKDQTAAERRRTQIRLAQRAYRSRKENAIQALELKVQGLQETNEEMGNAFMQLHDFAVNLGILEQAPEFARKLRATTEKFLLLARASSEDGGQDDRAESPAEEADRSPQQPRGEASSSPEVVETRPHKEFVHPWGGYIITTEPEVIPNVAVAGLSNTVPAPARAPLGYEVITTPTPENSSFPFGLKEDSHFPEIFGQTTLPSEYPLSPFSALPLPTSLAATEGTFGRRLQRTATERGYQLITMANPPKEKFAKVFGFCMLFEPLEKIRERLGASLQRTRTENLNYWQSPFWALGGMGQHHLPQDSAQGRAGNQGTADCLKHPFTAGGNNLGLGPFDAKTAEVRDTRIDPRMRIKLPGFQGDFFDAEEVELYLRSRGVTIQPGQDYLTTQVDVASFEEGPQGQTPSIPGFDDWPQNIDDAFDLQSTPSTLTPPAPPSTLSPGTGSSATGASSVAIPDVPSPNDAWPAHTQFPGIFAGGTSATGSSNFGDSATRGLAFAGNTNTGHGTPENRKRLVTLDVNAFIGEIVSRAVCLGRSAGFRPKDVNKAFWIATRSDGIIDF